MSLSDAVAPAISPRIGEKCTYFTDKSSPIPPNQKCLLCMQGLALKAFACIEEDCKKRYLCSHECFKKYYEIPFFSLDPAVKKARRKLKFEISRDESDGSISAKYEIKCLSPPLKPKVQNG